MESKFEKHVKILMEALPPAPAPEEEEGEEENINFDQDLPVEGEADDGLGMESPAAAESNTLNTPQEFELVNLAIKALRANNSNINPAIYDDFEKDRNTKKILNYLEGKLGELGNNDAAFNGMMGQLAADSPDGQLDPAQVQGKSISDRLTYYDQNGEYVGQNTVEYWTRIILNALKYDGADYEIGELTMDNIQSLAGKLKQDFNYDTAGMFDDLVKSRTTGSSLSGPGVF